MSVASPSLVSQPESGPSNLSTRTSGRTRVKSQRQLEAEQTERMITKAREQRDREAEAGSQTGSTAPATGDKRKKASQNRVKRGRVQETYCICKTDGEEGKPMIECGECQDWYHFDCIKLDEDEAERIHKYICPDCEEETGQKTTHTWDITTFASPTPPPGSLPAKKVVKPAAKPRKPRQRASSDDPSTASDSQTDSASSSGNTSDSGSEARPDSPASGGVSKSRAPAPKRQRTSLPAVKPGKPPVDRKTSITVPPKSAKKGALPPARLHIQMRLAKVVKDLFGTKMKDAEAEDYALDIEAGLWNGFSDIVGGKATVGARYKTQFNLLSSSLPRARPALLESIIDRSLTATQVAHLSSAELASAARLEELEAAKRAALEQTVKQREDVSAVRVVEGGVERVEDTREKEMQRLRREEEEARDREKRRESMISLGSGVEGGEAEPEGSAVGADGRAMGSGTPVLDSAGTGTFARPALPGKRSDSIVSHGGGHGGRQSSISLPPHSPSNPLHTPPVKVISAWGGDGTPTAEMETPQFGDQGELDLSDIVMSHTEEPDVEVDTLPEDAAVSLEAAPQGSGTIEKPVVWRGTINNPANPSQNPPRLAVRQVSGRNAVPINHWPLLLPQTNIEITGRVPTADSLKFLAEGRLNPKRDMVCATFELAPPAVGAALGTTDSQERKDWDEMIAFYIGRDRHGVYHPYAGLDGGRLPLGAAKEVYLVPLRPEDPVPEIFDLIDGFSIPKEGRELPIWLAVFMIVRDPFVPPVPAPAAAVLPPPLQRPGFTHPPPAGPSNMYPHTPHGVPTGPAAMQRPYAADSRTGPVGPLPILPVNNDALKALMATLGPSPSPHAGPAPYGPGPGMTPPPPHTGGGMSPAQVYPPGPMGSGPHGRPFPSSGPPHHGPQQGWQAPYPPAQHQRQGPYPPNPHGPMGAGYGYDGPGHGGPPHRGPGGGSQGYRSPYDERERDGDRERRDRGYDQGRRSSGNDRDRSRGGYDRERDGGWGGRGGR